MVTVPGYFYHRTDLAWTQHRSERQRYRRILVGLLIFFLFASVAIPLIPLPEQKRNLAHKAPLPPRYARFLFEKQALPEKEKTPPKKVEKKVEPPKKLKPKVTPKPKPVNKPKPKKKPVVKPKPKPKAKPKPKPKPKPVSKPKTQKKPVVKPKPKPKKTQAQLKKEAKAKVDKMFSGLFDKKAVPRIPANLNSIHLQAGKPGAAAPVVHDVITSNIEASEGIDSIQISARQVEVTQLAEPELMRIDSTIDTALAEEYQQQEAHLRSHSSIRLVFDREKGRQLNPLYTRALRYNPLLKGKVVLKLRISPQGKVLSCTLVSSQLHDERLEKRLIARVKTFDFGVQDVQETTVIYPIEFAPR